MGSRRAKRFERREKLDDQHVGVLQGGLGDDTRKKDSPHQDRLDKRQTWEEGGDPNVLAENLRWLVAQKRVTRQQVWEAIGEEKENGEKSRGAWFERVLRRGLSRVTPEARDRLERVARYFDLTSDDLWRPDLITFEVGRPRPEIQGYGMKLAELLLSGKHDYLRGLIDALHENLWRKGKSQPAPEPDDEPVPPPGQRTWQEEEDDDE